MGDKIRNLGVLYEKCWLHSPKESERNWNRVGGRNRSGIGAKSARNPDLVGEDFVDLCLAGQTALAGDEAGDRHRLDQLQAFVVQ